MKWTALSEPEVPSIFTFLKNERLFNLLFIFGYYTQYNNKKQNPKGGKNMKKKYMTGLVLAGVATWCIAGCGMGGADIGKDKAQEIAMQDAGVSEDEISRLRVTKDTEDGRRVYEVEFSLGNTDYDYEVAAADGEILSSAREESQNAQQETQDQAAKEQNPVQSQEQNQTSAVQTKLSMDDARALALKRVPGAGENDIRIELDWDDGQYKYEGDIIHEQIEYEFEIDANTGTFLEWSEERR